MSFATWVDEYGTGNDSDLVRVRQRLRWRHPVVGYWGVVSQT